MRSPLFRGHLFMTKSRLERQAQSEDPGAQARWGFLEMIGYGVCVANLPVGLVLVVGSYVASAVNHGQRKSETPMPDSWLKEVSESSEVSEKGLSYLASALSKKGFVSVADAVKWASIEKDIADKRVKKESKSAGLSEQGAQLLLARAKEEGVNLIDVDATLTSIRDGLKSTMSFTKNTFFK